MPQPSSHEKKDWFHEKLTRAEAEAMLKQAPIDGAFLVRVSQNEPDAFSVSFRAEGRIKHCRVQHEGRLYTLGTSTFENLAELVQFYQKNPLYHKVNLQFAVNEESLQRLVSYYNKFKI